MKTTSHPQRTLSGPEECRLYTLSELATLMGVSPRYVQILREHGAPFAMGRSRPDWLLEWIKNCAFQQSPPQKLPEKLTL